jgi:hypothetical protein
MTEPVENKSPQPNPHHTDAEKSGHGVLIAIIAVIVVIAIVVAGVVPRLRAKTALKKETDTLAVPEVGAIQPKRGSTAQEIILPGNIQAFIDAPIYARTNGYLKIWYFDIGAHVKKGQLLAEIETPEVDQQLLQARADLNTAQANLNLSQITFYRFRGGSRCGQCRRGLRREEGHRGFGALQCEPARRPAIFREGLCAV